MGHPLRILYAAGPGDVLGTYRHWRTGKDDPSQVSMTYSGQFYDLVRELDAETYVIACNPTPGRIRDGQFRIEHRAVPFHHASSALLYHFGQMWSALRLMLSAIWFRADVVVIVCGTCHWFPLRLLRLLRIKVVPTMHCVIWRKGESLHGLRKVIGKLNRKFFTRTVSGIMSASHDISSQVAELTGGRMRPVYEFLPSYRREQFVGLGQPPAERRPFRVFFAGRVERNKGVFDLLEIAKRFAAAGRTEIEFDLCGAGGALDELKAAVADSNTGGRFRCHGHCGKATMRDMFARCHVVIVPTTTEFIEGFNQVVAEGVLSGRPVITSSVCPALEYVRDAVVEVPPDDVTAYENAILKLCDDIAFYEQQTAACYAAQEQFYDAERGWAATLKHVLRDANLISSDRQPTAAWNPQHAASPKPS
jgi:glycosyltransferase involved in cell wall biosynthesis